METATTPEPVKNSKGELVGGLPFGYRLGRDGVTLRPNRKEQRNTMSLRQITERLNEDEVPARGTRWLAFDHRRKSTQASQEEIVMANRAVRDR